MLYKLGLKYWHLFIQSASLSLAPIFFDILQKVEKRERRYTNPVKLLQRHGLLISQEPYDASERTLKIALQPVDDKTWKSFMETPTSMVRSCNFRVILLSGTGKYTEQKWIVVK